MDSTPPVVPTGPLRVIGGDIDESPATERTIDDYSYFQFKGDAQTKALLKKLEEVEAARFDTEMAITTSEGNPGRNGRITHEEYLAVIDNQKKEQTAKGLSFVQTQVCPCNNCDIARLHEGLEGLTFTANKLREMYKTVVGSA